MSRKKAGEYKVGYGHPPIEHRFQGGKSGNPKGRPRKRAASLKEVLGKVLGTPISIRENGRTRRIPLLEAITVHLTGRGLKGDLKAFRELREFMKMADYKGEVDPGIITEIRRIIVDPRNYDAD